MNKRFVNKRRMQVVVVDYLKKNPSKLTFAPAMSGYVTTLSDLSDQIGGTHEAQLSESKGHTLSKENLRQTLIAGIMDIIKRVKAYSAVTENPMLVADAGYTFSELSIMPQNTLSDASHKVLSICQTHLSELADYGVTEAMLSDAADKLAAYKNALPEVKKVIAGRKVATGELKQKFDETDKLLKKMDALMEIISSSDPSFYQGYKNLRMIDDLRRKRKSQGTGNTVSGIALNLNTGLKQAGVKISVLGTNLSTLTDSEGAYTLSLPEAGIYTLKAELRGFAEAMEEDVEMEAGSITEVDFDLEVEE